MRCRLLREQLCVRRLMRPFTVGGRREIVCLASVDRFVFLALMEYALVNVVLGDSPEPPKPGAGGGPGAPGGRPNPTKSTIWQHG